MRAVSRASGIQVPRALGWGESSLSEAPLWLRTTKVPGRVRKVAELATVPQTVVSAVARSIGDALIETHRLLNDAVTSSSLPRIPETLAELQRCVEGEHDAEACAKKLAEAATRLKDDPVHVIHGDFNISNLLFEGDAVVSVLDFAEVRYGFLEEDIAAILSELPHFKDPLVAHLAAGGLTIDQRKLSYAFAVKAFLSFVICGRLGEREASASARRRLDEHLHDLLT
jgi:thiamine kinase-like enzyme